MERTLIIFKPDCMKKRLMGTVLSRFENLGYMVVGCKMMQLTPELLDEHYAHITHLEIYPQIVEFMVSHPVTVMVLEGEGVISKVRELMGPTDSTKAAKGTIRGDYGFNSMQNILHASDSPESAEIEMKRFFSDHDFLM